MEVNDGRSLLVEALETMRKDLLDKIASIDVVINHIREIDNGTFVMSISGGTKTFHQTHLSSDVQGEDELFRNKKNQNGLWLAVDILQKARKFMSMPEIRKQTTLGNKIYMAMVYSTSHGKNSPLVLHKVGNRSYWGLKEWMDGDNNPRPEYRHVDFY